MYVFFSAVSNSHEHDYIGNENYGMRNHDKRINPIFTKGGTPLEYSQNCQR